jgi:hypothetical protein
MNRPAPQYSPYGSQRSEHYIFAAASLKAPSSYNNSRLIVSKITLSQRSSSEPAIPPLAERGVSSFNLELWNPKATSGRALSSPSGHGAHLAPRVVCHLHHPGVPESPPKTIASHAGKASRRSAIVSSGPRRLINQLQPRATRNGF